MTSSIEVFCAEETGVIHPNIYGHFIEHLGRCVYGGIFDEGSPLSDRRGFRVDVLDAVKAIHCPILRWPGGNFASNYHWEDGIGPRDSRPVRLDTAWNALDNNHYGTDEFIEYCREIGAAPYICVNTGTGTLDEALRWVEYCNRDDDSAYAAKRSALGHSKPHQVPYWGIGNEIYGQWQHGHRPAVEYGRMAREWSHFMKVVAPHIRTIAVGANDPDWDLTVLRECGNEVDYLSIHIYVGGPEYLPTVAAAHYCEERLELLENVIAVAESRLQREAPIEIAFDEWNVWYRGTVENGLEETYALKDGLFAAGVFHAMHRHCRRVTMANLAQLVNVIGAIVSDENGTHVTPQYLAFKLYANHFGNRALRLRTESERFTLDHSGGGATPRNLTPYLDASAALTDDRCTLTLAVINRSPDQPIHTRIHLRDAMVSGNALAWELNGPDGMSANTFHDPDAVNITEKPPFQLKEHHTFPAHSVTLIRVPIEVS